MVARCVCDSIGNREPWRASEKGSDIIKVIENIIEMPQALTGGSWKPQC